MRRARGRRLAGWALGLLAALTLRAETLTVATYNVENYVATNRVMEAGYRQDYPKPEAAKRALRAVIRALDADVLALQEMGPRPYLDELRRDLRAEGLDYPYAALAEGADRDRHIAVLSKRPFKAARTHAGLDFPYFAGREKVKRGLLEIVLGTEAGDVTLWAVHLKSRFTDRPDDPQSAQRRLGEARAVRDFVLQRFPDPSRAKFLIAGDCNDSPASKPLQALTQRGKTTVARMLAAADARGETWTHCYRKEESYSRVDFALVSPALLPAVAGGAARIYDGPEVREASDHRPVVVRLELDRG
jgi:endonuclease/exonuclease/phosphatase family metal-dependent hydrolase